LSINSEIDRIESTSPGKIVLGLFVFNLLLKLALTPVNLAEYTDGILQITLFSEPNKLYPPFFTLLVQLLSVATGNPERAGRIISAISGALTVIPIFLLANSFFNKKAAFFASLLYTVSPVPLRWSIHSMTDCLFTLIFFLAIYEFLKAAVSFDKNSDKSLMKAIILTVLSTMTRYQGILFIPPLVLLIILLYVKKKRIPYKSIAAMFLWILPLLWMLLFGFRHHGQFAERAGPNFWMTFINTLNVFESFLAYSPYFLTWPICFLFLAGIFMLNWNKKEQKITGFLFLYLTFVLLILQAAFSSFQSRYLLPLIPMVCIFAGWGLSVLKEKWKNSQWLWGIVFIIALVYGMSFGLLSVFFQRESFADIKEAAIYINEIPETTPVYSNEAYKNLGPVKMRFWSGREVLPFEAKTILPRGSILCISSAYGGAGAFKQMRPWLIKTYRLELLASYESRLIPLFPDIMQEPHTHQNPLALTYRYIPQKFRTEIYRVP
jgi:dolichyl-phosphate-mannose-protein mannosyltransferase